MFLSLFSESLLEYAIKILKGLLAEKINYEWVLVATEIHFNNTLYNLITATQGNSSHKPTSVFQVDFCLSCTSVVI